MKNSILTLAAVVAVCTTSCKDFLDQTSPSEMVAQNVYGSVYYTSISINKMYGLMCQDATWSQSLSITWGLNTDCELVDGLGKEAATLSRNSERATMNYCNDPGWSKLSPTWDALYKVIEYSNLAIQGISSSPLYTRDDNDGKLMRAYRAEALTIRALCYLNLVRFWGDVPFKLEPSKPDLSNVYLPKTDRDEILEQLQVDLAEAAEILPWAGQSVGQTAFTQQRANKGFALALRANCAMTEAGYSIREKSKSGYENLPKYSDPVYPTQRPEASKREALYKQALEDLALIVKEGPHHLTPSCEEYWENVNQRVMDAGNCENLFQVGMGIDVSSELGYTVGVRINGASKYFGGKGNSSGKAKLTAPYLLSFDREDPRRDLTCAPYELREEDGTIKEKMIGNKPFGIYVAKWDVRKMSETWRQQILNKSEKWFSGIDPCLCRYAQVLLWYAEVANELGGPGGSSAAGITATEALRQVHSRAFSTSSAGAQARAEQWVTDHATSKESLFEAIVQENAWELAGEAVRKFDMIRWGNLMEKTEAMKAQYAELIQTAPKKLSYNLKVAPYTGGAKTAIDMSSVDYYDAGQDGTEREESCDFFGKEADTILNNPEKSETEVNVPYINYGLFNDGVLNRYICPIASTTISTSQGSLHNSYGYSD